MNFEPVMLMEIYEVAELFIYISVPFNGADEKLN
jgi:hypothetical protein